MIELYWSYANFKRWIDKNRFFSYHDNSMCKDITWVYIFWHLVYMQHLIKQNTINVLFSTIYINSHKLITDSIQSMVSWRKNYRGNKKYFLVLYAWYVWAKPLDHVYWFQTNSINLQPVNLYFTYNYYARQNKINSAIMAWLNKGPYRHGSQKFDASKC